MNLRSIAKKLIPQRIRKARHGSVSGDYKIIENPNRAELKAAYNEAWKNNAIPARQMKLSEKQVPDYQNVAPMKAAVDLLSSINTPARTQSLVEIGCSTGYYAEVFQRAGLNIGYEGCDYSDEFITKARELHPGIPFRACDATALPYTDGQFDIAISGCCILHIVDYPKAIRETARVAKKYALFHRTPVIHTRDTTFATKTGYGIPMLEIFFNEEELFRLFRASGLAVVAINTHHVSTIPGLAEPLYFKSYLTTKSDEKTD